jgi:Predicted periplasmic lipoprotein (DUF2279)
VRQLVLLVTAWLSAAALVPAAGPALAEEPAQRVNPGEAAPSSRGAPGLSLQPERSVDPLSVPEPSSVRKWGSLGGIAGVYLSATTYMYLAWYRGQPDLPSFRVGGDGYFHEETYAGGADKLGHAWANLAMSRVTSELLMWGGWTPWKAGLIASSMTLGLFTVFEVKDGYYTEFSPGDAVFNIAGAGLNLAMLAYPPLDELIDFRVEYFPSREYLGLLRGRRPPQDPEKPHQISLNFVEDYSGQRYLLAVHLGALPWLHDRTWARLVDVAVGYEAQRYKPDWMAPDLQRTQHLFLGLSVNMQGVIDLALADRAGGAAATGRAVGRLVFELINPPYGSIAVAGATRSPDD